MREAGSRRPGGPMRKAHGVALMCHSLWQAVEAGRRREGFAVNGLLCFIVSALSLVSDLVRNWIDQLTRTLHHLAASQAFYSPASTGIVGKVHVQD